MKITTINITCTCGIVRLWTTCVTERYRSKRRIHRQDSRRFLHVQSKNLRCRGLRSAGLDIGPDNDNGDVWRPMLEPTISPPCLSLSRDSFSARNRSSRFMIFFSRVLDIAPACAVHFTLLRVFARQATPMPGSPGSPHRRRAPDI